MSGNEMSGGEILSIVFCGWLVWRWLRAAAQANSVSIPMMFWPLVAIFTQSAAANEEMISMRKAEQAMRIKEFVTAASDLNKPQAELR